MPQPLPSKERSLFQQVVKNYESKQYKKGIKAADQVLRKFPDHGDTQAMKALILNAQSQTEEAFRLAKDALKSDMKSHICWHVYGLLYRSAKNFEESMKAYRMALRWEPDSQQIQRDLAMLQVQMRDYPGYVASRTVMLQARPGWRANWTALAIAQHMSGDLEGAEKTLVTYEDTLRSPPPKSDLEHQEAILYRNQIIAETGQIQRALEHLDAAAKRITDQQTVLELRAGYLLKLQRKAEAVKVYRQLLERNAEYRPYYVGLEDAMDIPADDVPSRQKVYAEYAEKNKRGDAAIRIPLDFLSGPSFQKTADSYLRRRLKRGVPSTFANLKALYSDHPKREMIIALVEGYKGEDSAEQTFKDGVLYFLAQHYDYHLTRDLEKASEAIELLLQQSPKSVDYLMTKARIHKHHGDVELASRIMEAARASDEKDRYINTKAAKYQLRNDQNDDALSNMSKFTKPDASGGPLADLTDMQSVWFMTEDGESRIRQNQLGLALKRFHTVYNIYDVWQEDQYDFHSFSLRKGQIRAYIEMLKWEDKLRQHPYYTRAALGAVRVYLLLDENPGLANGELANGIGGNANEKKKAAKKARKEAERLAQLEHERKDAKKIAGADGELKKVDPDPEGKQLAATQQPLEDALRFLLPLLEYSITDPEVQKIGFEVSLRRSKWLPALRCILAAHRNGNAGAFVHMASIRFVSKIRKARYELPVQVLAIIEDMGKSVLPSSDDDLSLLNEKFLSEHSCFADKLAGLQARHYLDPSKDSESIAQLAMAISSEEASLHDTVDGFEVIRTWNASPQAYLTAARQRWPRAKALQTR